MLGFAPHPASLRSATLPARGREKKNWRWDKV
jgi:hypothetical protein